MSKFEDGSYQCLPGPALIAKVLAGRCQMHYTRAAVGKGTLPEGVSPKELTEPPEYVMDAMIAEVSNPVAGECQVTVQINSSDVEVGFYANYIILYAEDPDEGEIPYTCLKTEDGLEWIRPKTSAVGKLATFDLIAAVGDVDAVTATIDPNAILTASAVKHLIADSTVFQVLTIPKEGWTDKVDMEGEPDELEAEIEDAYGLHLDIPVIGVTEVMQPGLCVHPSSIDTARACELATFIRTLEGKVRVYAKSAPSSDMRATLSLFCAYTNVVGGSNVDGDGYVLPAATATRLGGVKVGDGLSVKADGTISVDSASVAEKVGSSIVDGLAETDENVNAMLDEVYGTGSTT